MNISSITDKSYLLHEGYDDGNDKDVEGKECDGNPILKLVPVTSNGNPQVLYSCKDSNHHPANEKASVPPLGSNDEKQRTYDTKESIKDCILYEGPYADILSLTLRSIIIYLTGVLHYVQDGGYYSYQQLYDAYHYYRPEIVISNNSQVI